jgi:AcrR family transcriptional regulator
VPKITEAERAKRRGHLVDTAWRCLAARAYSDLTVDEVCSAAGVSKGAFYGYFASKQELLHALLAEDALALDTLIDELSATPISAGQRLRRFARASLRAAEDPARMQLRSDLWAALAADPAIEEALRSSAQKRRASLRTWIEQGIASAELRNAPANALASIILALADGLTLHHMLDPSGFKWRNVQAALDTLISGIEADTSTPDPT